jgi:putative membrane-bound dehydrogenase-like protein
MRLSFCLLWAALSAQWVTAASQEEPFLDPKSLPRFPPVEAQAALKTFKLKPGFRIELVAAEPLVRDPIEICFDESGRMFVVEMIDYSERRDARPHLGRIRRLEDTDEDGRFDLSTVFADDLPWPTAVFCWDGGVFAAATPDVFFLKDSDGDGKADTRQLVFTGFASDYAPYRTNQLNMQAMLNSFRWGLDNRIHGVTGPNGGEITSPLWTNAPPMNVRGRDFAFDPRTLRLDVEAGGGQYGLCFDDRGRRFTCNNSDHIRVFMYETRYAARHPFVTMPPPLVSIAADGPAAEVYRLSPDEPWRVIRTRWRVAGQVPGPIEGGGRPSGYFTSATGITIYRGDAWPEEFVGDAFIADCGSNLLHRKRLRPDGVALRAERPVDEQKTEFLASTDLWFRPVQLANAPDGTLYVIDMYREVIEHPWSIPQSIKKHVDLNSGNDRGRIYRIVPVGFKQPKPPRLGRATTEELVKTLEHRNAWHRETAARLLFERQDTAAAVPALEELLQTSPSPLGRMHALYALEGQAALRPSHVLGALSDADERVRQHAVRLAERFLTQKSPAPEALTQKLLSLASDPSAQVRYQLAFTLGDLKDSSKVQALAALLRRDVESSWVQAAVLSSLGDWAGEMFAVMTRDREALGNNGGRDFLRQLASLIGAGRSTNAVAAVIEFVNGAIEPATAFAVARALGEGLHRAGGRLPTADLRPVFTRADRLATNATVPLETRIQAIELLGLNVYAESGSPLLALLSLTQPQEIQFAAIRALGRFPERDIGPQLVQRWASLTPRLREEALAVLLARANRAAALLSAIEEGIIRPSDLSATQTRLLLNHREAKVRQQAARLLQTASSAGQRQGLVAQFLPSLELRGEAAAGKRIFLERCASCHRLGRDGYALGPDLASVKTSGKEKMLVSVLDPNRELLPQYVAYEVETREDETLLGLIANETAASVTVREAYGRETVVPRSNIRRLVSQKQSLMPEGLEAGLTPQDLANLLEFIVAGEASVK